MNSIRYILTHAPARAIATFFLCNGFFFGSWAIRIPELKQLFELDESELGFTLLAIAIGSLCIMPLMGNLSKKYGAGRISIILTFFFAILLPIPLSLSSYSLMLVVLFFMGISMGGMDIAMNTAAAVVEEQEDVRIMSSFHGFWSTGMMLGSAIGSLTKGAEIAYTPNMAVVSTVFLLLIFFQRSVILPIREEKGKKEEPAFALPGKNLLVLAVVILLGFLAEGAIADWSTLYMEESLNTDPSYAGWALSAFGLAMASGRFMGDDITRKIGPKKILVGGNLLVAISIGTLLLMANSWVAILGFGIAGIGFATIVPVIFSEAAKTPGMSTGGNMAAIGSVGYFGFLLGPPVIGFIADSLSLPEALGILALSTFLASILVKVAWKPPKPE